MPDYYLAIDIGASSGRHIIGYNDGGRMKLEEVYRFENRQIRKNGHDCWDTEHLWRGIICGLKECKKKGLVPQTIGLDTWGVDFVLLDKNDEMIGDAVAYRDGRTVGMDKMVEDLVLPEELYQRTGIQKASYNTIYQLMALKQENPEQLEQASWILMTPDYYNFRLTGIKTNEYTIASTTNLVNAEAKTWDYDLISKLSLPTHIFHDISMAGIVVGELLPEICDEVGFNAKVILPATHDTGSAFLAIPALDDNAVYISSGTWSLLGVENMRPLTTPESFRQNFTNEGGAWGRYRYLKNIMGLWIIQSIRRELNGDAYVCGKTPEKGSTKKWSFPELMTAAKECADFSSTVNVDLDCFLSPDSMIEAVKSECSRTGQQVPESIGELMQCVYLSLANSYRDAIDGLKALTGKAYTSINIVGGGCQDTYLNQLTAQTTDLPVFAGPIEGTAIGNLIVQMCYAGEWKDLQSARDAVRESFDIKRIPSLNE